MSQAERQPSICWLFSINMRYLPMSPDNRDNNTLGFHIVVTYG